MNIFNKQILKAIQKGINEGVTIIDDDDSILVKGNSAKNKSVADYLENDIISNNYDIELILSYFNSKDKSVSKMAEKYLFIDLDLPSKTKWCIINFGATCKNTCSSWYGNFYQWGCTKYPKKMSYTLETYKYSDSIDNKYQLNKYVTKEDYCGKSIDQPDNKIQLDLEDDIIYQTLKIAYIPTSKQVRELIDNTKHKYVTNYKNITNLNGYILSSKQDENKFMFIPKIQGINSGKCGLWSRTVGRTFPNRALILNLSDYGIQLNGENRYRGFPLRGVLK